MGGLMKSMRTIAAIAFAIALVAGLCKTSAMAVTFYPEDTAYRNAPQQTTPIDAFGYVGGILEARFYEPHATTNDPREEISEAASLYGIDLPMMLSIAKVESDFNPHARTGSYKGLFQLSDYEFKKYGDGSIWDARDNARAAAHMFLVQAERFKWALGHFPDYAERYMVHQQGIEGAIEHYEHPERVAWQSMCATSEGLLKGERWCKRCIWGNLLPRWKQDFGSVDKISSGDFVSLWTGRINLLADRYSDVIESVAGAASTNPHPSGRAPVRVISMRSHSRLHRTTERQLHGVVAIAKAEPLHSLAAMPRRAGQVRTRLSHAVATPVQLRRRTSSARTQRQASAVP
jgi:predicted GIY-YIG superfamily endonuclease